MGQGAALPTADTRHPILSPRPSLGHQGASSCCCAPPGKLHHTIFKYKSTVTKTVVKTTTAKLYRAADAVARSEGAPAAHEANFSALPPPDLAPQSSQAGQGLEASNVASSGYTRGSLASRQITKL